MDVKRFKQMQAANTSWSGDYWRPESGEHIIRIYPFRHVVTAGDFALKRYTSGEVKVGDTVEEFAVPVRKHMQPKIEICGLVKGMDGNFLGSCEVCARVSKLRNGTEEEKQAAKKWQANTKFTMNVAVRKANAWEILIWDAPKTVFDFVVDAMVSSKYADEELLGVNGRDLFIVYNKQAKLPKDFYKLDWQDRAKSVPLHLRNCGGEIVDLYADQKLVPSWAAQHVVPVTNPPAEAPTPPPAPSEAAPAPKRGRPKKSDPAASQPVLDPYAKGSRVWIDLGDDGGIVEGEIVSDAPDAEGLYHVQTSPDAVYSCTKEEMQLTAPAA